MPYVQPLPSGVTRADEILSARTEDNKAFQRGNQRILRAHSLGSGVHAFDNFNARGGGRRLRESDPRLRQFSAAQIGEAGWAFGDGSGPKPMAPYMVRIPRSSDGWLRFRSYREDLGGQPDDDNLYDEFGIRPFNEPAVLGQITPWEDSWLDQSVLYADLFGADQHLRIVAGNRTLRHLVEIASLTGSGVFDFEMAGNLDIYVDGQLWDKTTPVQTTAAVRLGSRTLGMRRFHAWDSAGEHTPILVQMRGQGNRIRMRKTIPAAWMNDPARVFPVYTDASLTAYGESQDAYAYVINATWATARGAATADGVTGAAAAAIRLQATWGGSTYKIERAANYFDLSAASGTATAADFNYYPTSTGSSGQVTICEGTYSDPPTALGTGDYDAHNSFNELIASGSRKNISGTWHAWQSLVFDAGGLTTLSAMLGGYGKMFSMAAQDVDNSTPTTAGEILAHASSEATEQPYLDVTYTPGAASSFVPKVMIY